jgi:hypothetical protein
MADNIAVTPGAGTTVATDDVGGVQYQRIKVSVGVDGVAADMTSGAGAVSAATPRVTLASDDPAVAALAALNYVEDAAAAANPSGPVNMLVRTDTPATQVSADGDNVAQRGTNYGAGYVTVLTSAGAAVNTFGGGTQYTEDAAAAADPVGNAVILVRKDTIASEVSADGDNVAQRGTSKGEAYTHDTDALAQLVTLNATVSSTDPQIGIVTETAPATDTASSGLNGRLQRIAQRLTTIFTSMFSTTAAADAARMPVSALDCVQPTIVTTGAASKTSTVTISNASPGVVTWASHGLAAGRAVVLTTSGTLPTPLIATNTVYVSATGLNANDFQISLTPGGASINTSSAGSGTHTATCDVYLTQDMTGYQAASFKQNASAITVFFEQSEDATTWQAAYAYITDADSTPSAQTSASTSTSEAYHFAKRTRWLRFRQTTFSATNAATVTLHGSPVDGNNTHQFVRGPTSMGVAISATAPIFIGGEARSSNKTALTNATNSAPITTLTGVLATKPYNIPEADWQFPSATSGIVNTTTAVTLVAAAGASIRNYCTGISVQTATLGGATELAIRDGAAGTVIWRTQLQTTALPLINIVFPTPLKGTANTLMEVVTLTAVTGGVYVNAQGYQAP